ncbi:transmembrane domain protein [Mycobacterium xenopi 4042]|uniref:Transmembrane domain protein n=1 Tax=Mycobacterium xenopi 4042 TaxID=1299334 RepID=X7ZBX9_MYCXE|nr:transmembrane domain protein [Mycobacterium xenopi 4042]
MLLAGLIRGRFAMQVWTGWSSSRELPATWARPPGPSTCCRRFIVTRIWRCTGSVATMWVRRRTADSRCWSHT